MRGFERIRIQWKLVSAINCFASAWLIGLIEKRTKRHVQGDHYVIFVMIETDCHEWLWLCMMALCCMSRGHSQKMWTFKQHKHVLSQIVDAKDKTFFYSRATRRPKATVSDVLELLNHSIWIALLALYRQMSRQNIFTLKRAQFSNIPLHIDRRESLEVPKLFVALIVRHTKSKYEVQCIFHCPKNLSASVFLFSIGMISSYRTARCCWRI